MDSNEGNENSQVKERVNHDFLTMAPEALDVLREIMNSPDVNPSARVQAISLILDRGLGKPEENIKVQSVQESVEAAEERIEKIVTEIRKKDERSKQPQ